MHFQNSCGGTPGPMDSFLTLRGTKTLHVRMDRHCDNAERVVDHLCRHDQVERVIYPGMAEHAQHAIAAKQMSRFGGMVSVELKASLEQTRKMMSSFEVFSLAESLGGVESLVDHPASMTHASIPAEERRAVGLQDGLIRLSVGIEDADDLIADLDEAISRAIR